MVAEHVVEVSHIGQFNILDRVITCAVSKDGVRILSGRGYRAALGYSANAKGNKSALENDVSQMPSFLASGNLKPFISKGFNMSPIHYRHPINHRVFVGYEATTLPAVCDVYLDARRAGVLLPHQSPIADMCEMLVRSLAKTGIVALIDEATGFQENRDKAALRSIFDRYLRKEFAEWSMTFFPEFYQRIFMLRNWKWDPTNPACGPRHLAQLTKDIVYERLAPGILEELEKRNPMKEADDGARRREGKHHQLLTEDVGRRELDRHLAVVTGLMRASADWRQFVRSLDRACPKPGHSVQLDFGDLPGIDLQAEAA